MSERRPRNITTINDTMSGARYDAVSVSEMKTPTSINFEFKDETPKEMVIDSLVSELEESGYTVAEIDNKRPWGGFIRLDSADAERFVSEYFKGVELPESTKGAELSPKFLIVEPDKQLSWQVHARRGELWRVIEGPVGVFRSETDKQPYKCEEYDSNETIAVPVEVRHRLVGLETRGIVAEIWIHTDKDNLSNEDDIRRVSDDFGRGDPVAK